MPFNINIEALYEKAHLTNLQVAEHGSINFTGVHLIYYVIVNNGRISIPLPTCSQHAGLKKEDNLLSRCFMIVSFYFFKWNWILSNGLEVGEVPPCHYQVFPSNF